MKKPTHQNMRQYQCLALSLMIAIAPNIVTADWRGFIAAESRFFPHEAIYEDQPKHWNNSLILEPEFYQVSEDESKIFTFVPFLRVDDNDSRRTHADIRQFDLTFSGEQYEVVVGVRKVFWGVVESKHITDIINQVDAIEDIDEEDRLGQPMLQMAWFSDWGTWRFFAMPYFRERTFPGPEGRLRGVLPISKHAQYESSQEQYHPDFAIRYSHTLSDWDFAISYFRGTGREPQFIATTTEIIPFYAIIQQSNIEVQYTTDAWLWKLESFQRKGQGKTFYAAVAGFEYTLFGITEDQHDLGLVFEAIYDDRDATAPLTYGTNDLFMAMRYTLNDTQDTQILAGVTQGLEENNRLLNIEASRRLTDSVLLSLDVRYFLRQNKESPVFAYRQDDFAQLRLSYYF